jgi:hypothetical protein
MHGDDACVGRGKNGIQGLMINIGFYFERFGFIRPFFHVTNFAQYCLLVTTSR